MGRRSVAGMVLLALAVGYGGFKAWPLVSGPAIRISELSTDAAGVTTLTGRAVHTETLMVNGGLQLIEPSGAFSTRLTLPRGGGILTLTATDRFGRSRTIERSVVIP